MFVSTQQGGTSSVSRDLGSRDGGPVGGGSSGNSGWSGGGGGAGAGAGGGAGSGWGAGGGGSGTRTTSTWGTGGGAIGGSGGGGYDTWGSSGAQKVTARDVDVGASENALRLAYQTRDMGADTMLELEYQGQQIDRIENKIESIHNNLDKGERLVRGIESLGGHILNGMTSQKLGKRPEAGSRELTWARKRPDKVEVPILLKHSNDLLTPATLVFEDTTFLVSQPGVKNPMTWAYDSVDKVIARARPLHVDVRFVKQERLRIASSFVQAIVNELHFRVPACSVEFEMEERRFDYGDDSIVISSMARVESLGGTTPGATSSPSGGTYFGVKKGTADLLSDNVGEDVRAAVQKQDQNLKQVGYLVEEMGQMSLAMGQELDRQNQQLSRVSDRTMQAQERIHNTTNRIDRIG
eukprot:TRINITY_DN2898_c0_g1_i1.p1 TRINITY_DN2898_c0_g1~~TRINITY_DN2898_c0_g1_i1.p1  ORF type:complete len:409 (+),score=67.66 TRINITY_DN2898_c0_g1_i1:471-1697(+)